MDTVLDSVLLCELQREPLLEDYFLAGGTALALQLGHRKSADIEMFASKAHDNQQLLSMLQNKYKYFELLNVIPNGIQVVIKNIRVDRVIILTSRIYYRKFRWTPE